MDIPDAGTNRINAAYAFGGAELLAKTIDANFGVPIHQVIEVDFTGFAKLVDATGGLPISFLFDARDDKSGLAVSAGTEVLDGVMAVAYVRSRSHQELQGGTWVSVGADDVGRTARQQAALKALVSSLVSPSGWSRLPQVIGALGAGLQRDESLGPIDLLVSTGFAYRGQIETLTLPVVPFSENGVSYVVADGAEATSAWSWLAGRTDIAKDE